MLFISAGGDVSSYPQLIDNRGELGPDLMADRVDQVILNDIEIQVGNTRVVVGLLQAIRVERDGEASDRIGEQITEHDLCVTLLAIEQVYSPHRIAGSGSEADEVHRPHVELGLFLG